MNKKRIKNYQEVAIKLLKPTKKQLAHGLELHQNSVVFDAYGFAPTAALDGNAMRKAIEQGASSSEIKDLSEDMLMTRYVENPAQNKEFREYFDASGVTCIFQNAGEEEESVQKIEKRMAHYTYVCDIMKDFVRKAVTPEDVINAKRQNKHCLYFSSNAVPLTKQWVSVEEELQFIKIFFQFGCRMMHLTYNRRNMIGDGCGETTNAGLSDFGKAVVREMNRVGVIVDVAHSGWQTSIDAAQVSTKPMVASHTASFALNGHYRNKPDDVIKEIAKTDGYVGICCFPDFLGRGGDIISLLDHIDYVAKKFGVEHVAIGTDSGIQSQYAEREWKKIPGISSQRKPWRSLWPKNPYSKPLDDATRIKGKESLTWTNWPLFTVGLVQRGYSDEDIRKIIGGNVIRVAREVLRV